MRFELTIDGEGSGPLNENTRSEVVHALYNVVGKISAGDTEGALLDTMGNTIGSWELTLEEVPDGE